MPAQGLSYCRIDGTAGAELLNIQKNLIRPCSEVFTFICNVMIVCFIIVIFCFNLMRHESFFLGMKHFFFPSTHKYEKLFFIFYIRSNQRYCRYYQSLDPPGNTYTLIFVLSARSFRWGRGIG